MVAQEHDIQEASIGDNNRPLWTPPSSGSLPPDAGLSLALASRDLVDQRGPSRSL